MCRFAGNNARGFTLAEAMIATVILAIASAGVLAPFVAGTSVRVEGQRRTLAAKLAGDLMEQIIYDPNEAKWDGYSEAQGEIIDVTTEAVFSDPAYSHYSREVVCEDVYLAQESSDDEPLFIRAMVKVYYNGRETASISRLISK